MQAAVHPLSTVVHPYDAGQYPQAGYQRRASAPNTRRASMVSPANVLSRHRSTKSLKERRRSSGAISTYSTMPKPRKMIGDYYVGKTLGKGASGRVKLGIHRYTGEQVAIKIISKSHLAANPAIEKAVRREIAIMKLIHHPNVMSLIDVIDDENSPDIHLILEYVEGGELFEYLVSKGRLSEAEARHHFQHIIFGLDYCHRHLICHRDLKPENLLLDSNKNIKIADFGMASLQPAGSMLETSCGSPHYASPEIVAGMPYNGSASDIWSCGVILYALLTGHLPFDDDNIRQLLKKVRSGKYTMPDHISRNAQDLIRRILVVDPAKRITMEQIMAHPWFREVEPANLGNLPVPPSPSQIGQPVTDPSEIDDRILETIKFLWDESSTEAVVRALLSKEHNMQKVVYVLLQQHAERYWQMDHEDDYLGDGSDESYHDIENAGTTRRRYRTIGHRSERDRRCMSMTEQVRRHEPRLSIPWIPDTTTMPNRRYSAAATVRDHRRHQEEEAVPPVPSLPSPQQSTSIKKSTTFYERFKGVLSRRSSKDREKQAKVVEDSMPMPPPKSTLRGGLLQRNKVDPEPAAKQQKKQQQLSIRVPNPPQEGTTRKVGGLFGTLSGNRHQQRKQIDLAVFEAPAAPPALSDGSTLSSSSSSSSGSRKPSLPLTPPPSAGAGGKKRGSQASILLSPPFTPTTPTKPTTNWLSNLFFFKQPKVCQLHVYDTDIANVLQTLHRAMSKTAQVRFYEKTDKYGTRYKIEINKQEEGKARQVKCRMEFILPSVDQTYTRVQFTQQQGDALTLISTVRQAQAFIDAELEKTATVC